MISLVGHKYFYCCILSVSTFLFALQLLSAASLYLFIFHLFGFVFQVLYAEECQVGAWGDIGPHREVSGSCLSLLVCLVSPLSLVFPSCRCNFLLLLPPHSKSGSSLADLELHSSSINLRVSGAPHRTSLALRHKHSDISDQYGCHSQSFSNFTEPLGFGFSLLFPLCTGANKMT